MDPLWLLSIPVLLFASALFSGSEIGLYGLSRVKLRFRENDRGDVRAKTMAKLLHPVAPTIITILIGNNIVAQILSSVIETPLNDTVGKSLSILITIIVLTPLLLIFGEFLPKHLFHRHADSWMYVLARPLWYLRNILCIPVWLIQIVTNTLRRLIPGKDQAIWEPHTSRPNLRTFLKDEQSGHGMGPVQQQLVDRILALERLDLRYERVIRPTTSIASLDALSTIAAARNNLGPKYFQRYLVSDHHNGQPIGYITAIALATADGNETIGSLAQPLPTLPATTPILQALQTMHAAGADLALVANDQGERDTITFRGDCLRIFANFDRGTAAYRRQQQVPESLPPNDI